MRRVRQFLKRSPTERRLLPCALALHVVIAILLRCVSFSRLRGWGARVASRADAGRAALEPAVLWAAATAAALLPFGNSCLPEALTAHWMLRAICGRASEVRFGVAPAPGVPLVAHAWLELDGRAVIGWPDGAAYLALDPPHVGNHFGAPSTIR